MYSVQKSSWVLPSSVSFLLACFIFSAKHAEFNVISSTAWVHFFNFPWTWYAKSLVYNIFLSELFILSWFPPYPFQNSTSYFNFYLTPMTKWFWVIKWNKWTSYWWQTNGWGVRYKGSFPTHNVLPSAPLSQWSLLRVKMRKENSVYISSISKCAFLSVSLDWKCQGWKLILGVWWTTRMNPSWLIPPNNEAQKEANRKYREKAEFHVIYEVKRTKGSWLLVITCLSSTALLFYFMYLSLI